MIVWIVLASILLVLWLLLQLSLTVYLRWGETFTVQVGIAGFRKTVLPQPEEKPKEEKEEEAPPEEGKEKKDWQAQLQSILGGAQNRPFGDLIADLIEFVQQMWPPIGNLIYRVRLCDLHYHAKIGAPDAHQVALRYAAWSTAFYQILGLLKSKMSVRCRSITIAPCFTEEGITQEGRVKIKLRLQTLLFHGILIGVQYIRVRLRADRLQKNKLASK